MKWWQIRKRDADLERELQSDLDLEEEEQRERGLTPEEARFAAHHAFGNPTLIREQTRAVWTWNWLERLVRDLKYGARTCCFDSFAMEDTLPSTKPMVVIRLSIRQDICCEMTRSGQCTH